MSATHEEARTGAQSSNPYREFDQQVRRWVEQGRTGPHSVFLEVGRIEARVLLQFSTTNRRLRDEIVQQYGRDIAADCWSLTHQGIGFTLGGRLYDGHHRLTAIAEQKEPSKRVRLQVTFGMPEQAVGDTDKGLGRTMSDRLMLGHNVHMSSKEAAILRVAVRLASTSPTSNPRTSDSEMLVARERFAAALDALRPAFGARFPASAWGALVFIYPANPMMVTAFALDVARGTDLAAGSPAYRLREWLITADSAGAKNALNISVHTLYAAKAFLEDRSLSKFSVKDDPYHILEWGNACRRKAGA